MILQSIALTNFKNIAAAQLDFSPKINCLLGDNGMGKSNLLDAIHYLSFVRSYGRLSDSLLIRRGEDFAILKGQYLRGDTPEEITAGLRRGGRKSLRRGGKEYKRLSTHIGLLPAVMVAPADLSLVTESGEERRRFADMIISQSDTAYLDALIRYNHLLEQRNRLLRDGAEDRALYETIEVMMDAAAAIITDRRQAFVDRLTEIFVPYYNRIADTDEVPALTYAASTAAYGSLLDALEHNRRRDHILTHTSVGPHRDDIVFSLDDMPLRATASQGQTKTFTIALRICPIRLPGASHRAQAIAATRRHFRQIGRPTRRSHHRHCLVCRLRANFHHRHQPQAPRRTHARRRWRPPPVARQQRRILTDTLLK